MGFFHVGGRHRSSFVKPLGGEGAAAEVGHGTGHSPAFDRAASQLHQKQKGAQSV